MHPLELAKILYKAEHPRKPWEILSVSKRAKWITRARNAIGNITLEHTEKSFAPETHRVAHALQAECLAIFGKHWDDVTAERLAMAAIAEMDGRGT